MTHNRNILGFVMHNCPDLDCAAAYAVALAAGMPGASTAKLTFSGSSTVFDGETGEAITAEELFEEKGLLCADMGGGAADHHAAGTDNKGCAASLIAEMAGVHNHPLFEKVLHYVERNDLKAGNGCWEIPGLMTALNKLLPKKPELVVRIGALLLMAKLNEQALFLKAEESVLDKGIWEDLYVLRRKFRLFVIVSDESEVHKVALRKGASVIIVLRSDGHVQIFTQKLCGFTLRPVAAELRIVEAQLQGLKLASELDSLGAIPEIPEWYLPFGMKGGERFETGVLLNGSSKITDSPVTQIDFDRIVGIVKENIMFLDFYQNWKKRNNRR